MREDFGVITDHFVLPIRSIFAIRPTSVDRFVKLDVGPLICSDGRHFDPVKNTIRNLFKYVVYVIILCLICYKNILVETCAVSDDFLCRSGKIVPMSQRCILDYDVYGDVTGCRDLSHLDDCGIYDAYFLH